MDPNDLQIIGGCYGGGSALALNHMDAGDGKMPRAGVWRSTNGHNFVRSWPAPTVFGLPGEDCAFAAGVWSAGNKFSIDGGLSWTDSTSDGGVGNRGLAYGNGVFVGAGDSDMNWSADGKAWHKATPAGGGSFVGLSHVVFGGNKFLATPFSNANPSWESTDGKTWTRTKQQIGGNGTSNGVGAAVHKLFNIESDGVYWLPDDSAPGESNWTKVAMNIGGSAIGGTGSIAVNGKYWSTDGLTWTAATTAIPNGYSIAKILVLK
jgi:hypothetical protein